MFNLNRIQQIFQSKPCWLSMFYSQLCWEGCRQQPFSPASAPRLMRMRTSSEKHIAGASPPITFLWLGALPKTDALMKAYVPKRVSLRLAIEKKKKNPYSRGYVFILCFGALPFQSCFIDSAEGNESAQHRNVSFTLFSTAEASL